MWLPRKSLDTEFRHLLLARKFPVEDDPGNEDGREYVCHQTDNESDCEAFHGAGTEDEQEQTRDNRRHVCVHDCPPRLAKPCLDSRRDGLPCPKLLANAFED